MNLAPRTRFIDAIRSQHTLDWPALLAELIDNALDASATEMTLDFSQRNTFVATDNGNGCKDLSLMLAFGGRADHKTTKSGKYGIGAKDAMIGLGEHVQIVSTHDKIRRRINVNWTEVCASGSWEVNDPIETATNANSGTEIIITRLVKPFPTSWPNLEASLARTFKPAMRQGQFRLLIRTAKGGARVVPCPADIGAGLSNVASHTIDIGTGKIAVVWMGMISDPAERTRAGTTIAIAGRRVIRERTRIGLGEDPTPGLFAYIELSNKWDVSKNKDDLSAKEKEELHKAIASHPPFAILIRDAQKSGQDISVNDSNRLLKTLNKVIADKQNAFRKTRKAKRAAPVNHTGTVIPTHAGNPHKQAQNTQPGSRFAEPTSQSTSGNRAAGSRSLFQLVPQAMGNSDLFVIEGDRQVNVNTDHLFYAKIKGATDDLVPLAIGYFAAQKALSGQRLLKLPELQASEAETFSQELSYLLSAYVEACKVRDEQP